LPPSWLAGQPGLYYSGQTRDVFLPNSQLTGIHKV
jgi:hypothetical protein